MTWDAVFIDGWVGMSTDRLIRAPFLSKLVSKRLSRVQEQSKICSHLSQFLRRSMEFASHLRHRGGRCDTVITISAVTDGKDAQRRCRSKRRHL